MELRFYPEVTLGGWRLVNLNRSVKGNMEILVLAQVWLPLYPQVYTCFVLISDNLLCFYDSNLLRHKTFVEMSHCSTCKCASASTLQFNFKRKVGDAWLPGKAVGTMPSLDISDIDVHVLLTPFTG